MINKEDKRIGMLFYTAGRFEGLKADAGSTIEFIESNDGRVLPSTRDKAILRDMKEGWYAIDADHKPILADYQQVHGHMISSTSAPVPGKLRERPVGVMFGGCERRWRADYAAVTPEIFEQKLSEAIDDDKFTPAEKASRAFLNIDKLQPFPDGNKRTALLVANRTLIDSDHILLVPYTDAEYQEFMQKLEQFYNNQLSLDEIGEWFSKKIVRVDDLDISMPFGEIVNNTADTKTFE